MEAVSRGVSNKTLIRQDGAQSNIPRSNVPVDMAVMVLEADTAAPRSRSKKYHIWGSIVSSGRNLTSVCDVEVRRGAGGSSLGKTSGGSDVCY